MVAIDLTAVPEDLRRANFGLGIVRAGDPATNRFGDWSSYSAEVRNTDSGERRYRYLLPSGSFVVRGGCGLFAIPDTPLDLTDEQDDVTVTIAANP